MFFLNSALRPFAPHSPLNIYQRTQRQQDEPQDGPAQEWNEEQDHSRRSCRGASAGAVVNENVFEVVQNKGVIQYEK